MLTELFMQRYEEAPHLVIRGFFIIKSCIIYFPFRQPGEEYPGSPEVKGED
jgi:hypothetical protein